MTDANATTEPPRLPTGQSPDTPSLATTFEQARLAATEAGLAYARQCVARAFELIRRTHPAAATLVADQDLDDDGDTTMLLLAVRGGHGDLLWFHQGNYSRHPDAVAADGSPDLDLDVVAEVEDLLRIAYGQPGDPVLDPADVDDYQGLWHGSSWSLLTAQMPASQQQPDGRAARTVSSTPPDCPSCQDTGLATVGYEFNGARVTEPCPACGIGADKAATLDGVDRCATSIMAAVKTAQGRGTPPVGSRPAHERDHAAAG